VPHRRPSPRVTRAPRRLLHALVALALVAGSVLVGVLPAYAEDPGFLTLDKTVSNFDPGETVEPGDTFVYTITITCSNTGIGAGCTNAELTDALPEGISLNDGPEDITIGGANGTASAEGNDISIDFTDPLEDPADSQGLDDGAVVTVQIPVIVDDDISPDLNGQDLTNTATVDGTNTDPASDSFVVVPDIPIDLNATTDKSFDPSSAVADPGTETIMTLSGGNADTSNVPADEIVITDPNDPPGPPGAFEYLAVTGDFDVTLPAGAEQVRSTATWTARGSTALQGPTRASRPAWTTRPTAKASASTSSPPTARTSSRAPPAASTSRSSSGTTSPRPARGRSPTRSPPQPPILTTPPLR
jgi:fimbrial isopeptide formation D2 family protein